MGLAGIGGVGEQRRNHALSPAGLAGRAGHAGLEQTLTDHSQADALLGDPVEQAADHRGRVLHHLAVSLAIRGLVAADIAIAVRRAAQHTYHAGLG
jgi:hypothetical protein